MLPQDWIEVSRGLYKQNQQSLFQRPSAMPRVPLVEGRANLAQTSPVPDACAINNSFVDNKVLFSFIRSGGDRSIHTQQVFRVRPLSAEILDQAKVGRVVLFRSLCSTYATVCREPGLRARPRLTKLLESSFGMHEQLLDRPARIHSTSERSSLAKTSEHPGQPESLPRPLL
jgi:hypothetical protein